MSTAISLFNQASVVDTSYLKGISDATNAKLAGGNTGKRLSIRGGVFRMMSAGQEVKKSPDRYLYIVVTDVAPHISRTYYKGTYQEGVVAQPTCWSDSGDIPDDTCATPMATSCINCQMNIKGSGQGESKACRFTQRLAVVLADDIEGDVYGLNLAATSIFGKGGYTAMPLHQYTKKLSGHGLPIRAVVTKMSFDLDSATPKLVFSAERPLSEAEYQTVIKQSLTEESLDIVAPPKYSSSNGGALPFISSPAPDASEEPPVLVEPAPVVRSKTPTAPVVGTMDIKKLLSDWE